VCVKGIKACGAKKTRPLIKAALFFVFCFWVSYSHQPRLRVYENLGACQEPAKKFWLSGSRACGEVHPAHPRPTKADFFCLSAISWQAPRFSFWLAMGLMGWICWTCL